MSNQKLTIGFDVSQTGKYKAGCGFFAENLISHLAILDDKNDYVLYPTFGDHYWHSQYKKTIYFNLPNFSKGLSHTSILEAKNFWQNLPNDWENKFGSVDVIHANNFFCPPKLKNSRLVYTLYDLSFIENPEYTTEHNRIACFDGVFRASLTADHILAISDYSRRHFLEIFPHYPSERISVIHPASRYADPVAHPKQSQKMRSLIPGQFWLNVGTLEPRKNIKRLLEAYAKLKYSNENTYPLVIAGGQGWMMSDINNIIKENNLENDVIFLGYVDDNELMWLYQNCYYFVYPSLFEGFGLPVLEAMTLNAPVITSNISSIPEITKDASILINPTDEFDILYAMQNAATDINLRQTIKEKGMQQAKNFSWKKTAQETLNLYKLVTELPKYNISH